MGDSKLALFKDKHKNEACYIFGSGPTIKNFKPQEKGIYIGCNNSIDYDFVSKNIDYCIFGHGYMDYKTRKAKSKSLNQRNKILAMDKKVVKLCLATKNKKVVHDYDSKSLQEIRDFGGIICDLNTQTIHKDISKNPFINYSVVFPAVQLALYAGCKKIYIVGCDCSGVSGSWHSSHNKACVDCLVKWWGEMYKFKKEHYPHVKFININPVCLKGKFDQDIITK